MNTLIMKLGALPGLVLAGVFAVSPAVLAQEDDPLDMEVVESGDAGEEAVTREIALPESAAPEAHENAAYGLETANQARERGREFGQNRAAEARERGRELREAVRGGPGDDLPGAPSDIPRDIPDDLPGRP